MSDQFIVGVPGERSDGGINWYGPFPEIIVAQNFVIARDLRKCTIARLRKP